MYLYHLAPAASAPFIAAGPFKGEAGVFDLRDGRLVSRFPTSLDFGGPHLALNPDASILVAAAYERHGISAHAAATGEVLWRRQDIKRTGRIGASADGTRLFVRSSRFTVLDIQTGEEVGRRRGVERVWESRSGGSTLLELATYRVEDSSGATVVTIPPLTFALLDCAFTPEVVALSESGGPVRGISRRDGRERWRITPVAGTHVLRLAYTAASGDILALEWPYEKGGETRVLVLDPSTGAVKHTWSGAHRGSEFCLGGTALVYPDGSVHEARTGAQMLSLEVVPDWPDLPAA
jgi:hypothetical protein